MRLSTLLYFTGIILQHPYRIFFFHPAADDMIKPTGLPLGTALSGLTGCD
jgi:hypothetical protein